MKGTSIVYFYTSFFSIKSIVVLCKRLLYKIKNLYKKRDIITT
ncbi:hypothetical protein CLG_B1759 [Clostridium botulinum D str. 1873]|uniref:Uncharacterized protein n=1 Tax=Clostridium botulinum D str. 1873 TaxID=592027 RepID=A0A9P2G736_CLOBO|nr:hypothetical protein CLG_B1759 [Clostridium botulinum D str. 1873]